MIRQFHSYRRLTWRDWLNNHLDIVMVVSGFALLVGLAVWRLAK
jgi:hypothetical protein